MLRVCVSKVRPAFGALAPQKPGHVLSSGLLMEACKVNFGSTIRDYQNNRWCSASYYNQLVGKKYCGKNCYRIRGAPLLIISLRLILEVPCRW